MELKIKIKLTHINGVDFISIKQMSRILNKSDQTIYNLIRKGNAVRKMKHIKIGGSIFIPYIEIEEFPFTYSGKNVPCSVYHYNYDGTIKEGIDEPTDNE